MRKFIFNFSVISAVISGVGAVRATTRGPRDWRTAMLWIGWAATTASVIGTVILDARQAELEED